MMRFLRDAIITIVLVALVAAAAVYVQIRRGGLSADAQPGTVERAIAARLVRLSIPPDAKRQQNPLRDGNAWRSAVAHFQDHCALCHGRDGRGRTGMGDNMYPKVPDLTASATQTRSDGELFYIIQNGVRWTGMPAWKREHSPEETWSLVSFIRKMPSVTGPELEQIEREMSPQRENSPSEPSAPHQHKHSSTPHKHS
jgi:mono/diheme cytochrome c family protein